jgi:hypothetical protein
MRMQYLRQVRSSADRLAGTTVRGRNEAVPTAPFEPMIDDILMMRPQPCATMPSRHDLSRQKFIEWFANREPCLVAMEACSAAHCWARQLRALGHGVRLIAPQFVAPYRKGGTPVKNDAVDAEAICEAASRPHMRFVPVKTPDQQSVLAMHRMRDGFVEERTALVNRLRGLLVEFGVFLRRVPCPLRRGSRGWRY